MIFRLIASLLMAGVLFVVLHILYWLIEAKFRRQKSGKLSSPPSRKYSPFELNAAIETMFNESADLGKRLESARMVVDYGQSLEVQGQTEVQFASKSKDNEDSTTGFSPGHGNVTITPSENKGGKPKAFSNIVKERVGHYRIWKPVEGSIKIHEFWASGIATQSSSMPVQKFTLRYNPKSLEFLSLFFDKDDEESFRSFWIFGIGLNNRHYLLGYKAGQIEYGVSRYWVIAF